MTDQIQSDGPEDTDRDQPRTRRRRARRDEDREDDDYDSDRFRKTDPTGGLIPYRNAMALTGYYLAVFSLIPCVSFILGPAAIILGFLGLNYAKKHPSAGGTVHAVVALVLGGLTTLGYLALIVLMGFAASLK